MYNKEKTTALLSRFFALLCNGSTADSGSVCPGSSPGEATLPTPKVGIFFVPHYLFLLYFSNEKNQRHPAPPPLNTNHFGVIPLHLVKNEALWIIPFLFRAARRGPAAQLPHHAPSRFPLLLLAAISTPNIARMASFPTFSPIRMAAVG